MLKKTKKNITEILKLGKNELVPYLNQNGGNLKTELVIFFAFVIFICKKMKKLKNTEKRPNFAFEP
jgi:hypothetical protein